MKYIGIDNEMSKLFQLDMLINNPIFWILITVGVFIIIFIKFNPFHFMKENKQ